VKAVEWTVLALLATHWKGIGRLDESMLGDVMIATELLIVTAAILFGMALFFASFLTIAKAKLHVAEDPRILKVQDALPSANCGGCGFAGCGDFAKAVVEGRANATACTVGGPGVAQAIAAVLGIEVTETAPSRPVIHCGAKVHDRLGRVPYEGVASCVEAHVVGVTQACTYGCLGFGDCVEKCEYDALHIVDGLPVVDYDKCTGCGACTRACPRNLIEQIPFAQDCMLVVTCSNQEPGKNVKKVCKSGCIGCKKCQKLFTEVFSVKDNLADVDYGNYPGEGALDAVIEQCPTGVLAYFGKMPAYTQEHVSEADTQKMPDAPADELAGEPGTTESIETLVSELPDKVQVAEKVLVE